MSTDDPRVAAFLETQRALVAAFGPEPPEIVMVLGSGFGGIVGMLEGSRAVRFGELGLPATAVSGHYGQVVVGTLGGRRVACFGGRCHLYEGHDAARVVQGLRAMVHWGARGVVLTASVGSLHADVGPGEAVVLTAHINFLGHNPLRGPNIDELGPRFPDLTGLYSPALRKGARRASVELGIVWHEGVYAAMPGPSFETPAEIRMLRAIGADVVGMSVVPEAIVAAHAGLPVFGVTVVANLASGMSATVLEHEACTRAVAEGAARLTPLLERLVRDWDTWLGQI